jgi:hypothetical protein
MGFRPPRGDSTQMLAQQPNTIIAVLRWRTSARFPENPDVSRLI